MLGWFFGRVATIQAVSHPQDVGGGEVPTPSTLAVLVPCAVQQDGPPEPTTGKQGRRGSTAKVKIFLRPSDPPGVLAVQALKVDDRIPIDGFPYPLILDGPPFDASGRGVVWEAAARDIR